MELLKLLAESLNLNYVRDGIYVGDCPFCGIEDAFAINTNNNYSTCLFCDKERGTLISTVKRLIKSSSSAVISGRA